MYLRIPIRSRFGLAIILEPEPLALDKSSGLALPPRLRFERLPWHRKFWEASGGGAAIAFMLITILLTLPIVFIQLARLGSPAPHGGLKALVSITVFLPVLLAWGDRRDTPRLRVVLTALLTAMAINAVALWPL